MSIDSYGYRNKTHKKQEFRAEQSVASKNQSKV
jgi:hypothetical protein